MAQKILLVPKIHFFNLPLFFLLSFIYKIKTLEMRFSRPSLVKKKIDLLRLEKYFDWEKCMIMRANAVKLWEDILPGFQEKLWDVRIKGFILNMTKKTKQDMQKEFEKLFLLKNIADYYKNSQDVYIINSLHSRFIASISKNKEFIPYPTIHFLSFINTMLDMFFLCFVNFSIGLKLINQLIYGLLNKKENASTIKYIWDGISPRELSVDEGKNTFSWIIDDDIIRKEEILFLLPKADFQMRHFSGDEAKKKGLIIANHYNMVCFAHTRILLSSLYEVLRLVFIPNFTFKKVMKNKYALQVLEWYPVAECLKPKVYVNSFSNVGIEEPAVIYFQKIGIKTIMWAYGTNSYLFTTHNEKCDFRNVNFCNILSSALIVWNSQFKDFIESHAQNNLEVIVTGPLMGGDESVFDTPPDILRKRMGFNHTQNNNSLKFVAVFDSPPVSKAFRGSEAVFPDSNTEQYNYAFIKDVFRLLSDFENLFILYKPKRSLTSGKFLYNDEMRGILEEMHKNPRVIILDYNINPWLPFAAADMTVSMPFESTFIVSLHYGKPAVFHDPVNIAHYHKYQDLSDFITHSYTELKSKINSFLIDRRFSSQDVINEPKFKDFVVSYPAKNSTVRFREYLASLSGN